MRACGSQLLSREKRIVSRVTRMPGKGSEPRAADSYSKPRLKTLWLLPAPAPPRHPTGAAEGHSSRGYKLIASRYREYGNSHGRDLAAGNNWRGTIRL